MKNSKLAIAFATAIAMSGVTLMAQPGGMATRVSSYQNQASSPMATGDMGSSSREMQESMNGKQKTTNNKKKKKQHHHQGKKKGSMSKKDAASGASGDSAGDSGSGGATPTTPH